MSIKDNVQDSMRVTTVLAVAAIGGSTIWVVGYDAGYQKALQQPQKPTVIFGTQIINNSNSYWSPGAGTVSNQEQPKQESTPDK